MCSNAIVLKLNKLDDYDVWKYYIFLASYAMQNCFVGKRSQLIPQSICHHLQESLPKF